MFLFAKPDNSTLALREQCKNEPLWLPVWEGSPTCEPPIRVQSQAFRPLQPWDLLGLALECNLTST